jgi:hypothetical protein
MKRRKFGLLAGISAIAATLHKAEAQSVAANPALLKTTLTPFGGERAGNADGSIPAWTGGAVAPPDSPTIVQVFTDEKPYLTVTAENMAQYQNLVSDGVMAMMTKYGFSIQVYPTHRTAAAPQYVYDNIANNVARTKPSANGGRFGFTGGYGGTPFPIPDMSDPYVAGAQIIWNHLTAWAGFCSTTTFSAEMAVSNGELVISQGDRALYKWGYYDPNGSLETFDGYLNRSHIYFTEPSSFNGQEVIAWRTANTELHPDIVWTLLNGQGRVRKAPDEEYDTPSAYSNGVQNYDEGSGFSGDPSEYDWKCLGKQELFIPYHNNAFFNTPVKTMFLPKAPNPDVIRWEKHRVWVVEATLHPGNRNVIARRRFYLDEDTWLIAIGDCYDGDNNLAKVEVGFNRSVPALPGTTSFGSLTFNLLTGDYVGVSTFEYPPYKISLSYDPLPSTYFDPQQMSAGASF